MILKGPIHHPVLVLLGADLFAIIWFLEASIRTFIFPDGNFVEHAFTPGLPEIWTRFVVATLVLWMFFLKLTKTEQKTTEADRRVEQLFAPVNPHTQTLLVVHDDPSMRRLIKETLQPLGYQVLEASCCEDALEVGNSRRDEIDLLLTDMDMAGMSVHEMVEHFQGGQSAIQVVYMASDRENSVGHLGEFDSNLTFIQKPITPDSLANSLREALNIEAEELKKA
jgi:CheY-like chemotaxis protein